MTKQKDRNRQRSQCPKQGTSRGRSLLRGCKGENRKIMQLLLERGWTVLRSRRHLILAHEDTGAHYTLSCTSSDVRAARAAVTILRRHMGVDLRQYL